MMNGLIIIFGIILLFGLLYYEKKKKRIPHLIIKAILSLLFVITALLQPHSVPAYYHYLLVGLIFCLIGDVCLALPQKKAFMGGLVAFLVGHVLYIFSFSSLIPISHWFSSGLLIIVGISALIFFWLRPHLKSMLIPVLIYIMVITIMASGAWAVFWKSSFEIFGRALILTGSLCFYLSDLFVARHRFIKEEYRNRLLGLPLYYAGQFMLAFSIDFL
ncbi:MAG: lysoplasmalogenase [Thermodesulfobacteriota bacterium]|nr:lysoplasmalogenase [Thermodesulfobacteriota bacterium]